jgi:DNA-binding PucR family transcriptional regulator
MDAGATARPSEAAIELVRVIAAQLVSDAVGLFDEVHDAVAASAPEALLADPALTAEIERSNAAVLGHWLAEVVRDPGATVEPLRTPETLEFARDVAWRGLEDMTFNYFRVGLAVASRYVMEAAFAQSKDPPVIREALRFLLWSSSVYVDRSAALIHEAIAAERASRASSTLARRLDLVTDVLDGDTFDTASASRRLGFELDRPLFACILWVDPSLGAGVDVLEGLARQVAVEVSGRSPLLVAASAASLWAWIPTDQRPDSVRLRRAVASHPGVRLAIGSVARGVAGFRASYQDAARTQRVMHRVGGALAVARFDEVRVVALAGADEPAAAEFTRATLGSLASAPPVIRETVRGVIAAGFDTAAAAVELGVHRNTVLARMRRARELLPEPAAVRWVDVALALELAHWQAPEPGRR